LAEAEETAGNLFTILVGMSLKVGEAIERASILIGQLKKVSLSLVIIREEEVIIALRTECIICHFITLRVWDRST
jgi:hypothetical protein